MYPEILGFLKFLVVVAAAMGTILGTAKLIGGALSRRPEPIREYDTRFLDGDKRMDRLERQLGDHDKRFGEVFHTQADLRVEMAELRPMFKALQEKVNHLKDQAADVSGVLKAILTHMDK